jgi:hypothetical protein
MTRFPVVLVFSGRSQAGSGRAKLFGVPSGSGILARRSRSGTLRNDIYGEVVFALFLLTVSIDGLKT